MKKKFLNSSISLVKKNGNYTDEQLEVIAYGLEGVYLTITKMIFLFALAYIFGIVREFVLLLFFYNIIRSQAFGLHATKSIYCLISSTILFIGGALICKYVTLPFWFLVSSAIVCDGCLFLYAPADTHKRPLVNSKKRKRFRFFSVVLGLIYTILIIIYKDYFFVNYLSIGLIEGVLMILPVSYQLFHLPYDNYKTYYSNV